MEEKYYSKFLLLVYLFTSETNELGQRSLLTFMKTKHTNVSASTQDGDHIDSNQKLYPKFLLLVACVIFCSVQQAHKRIIYGLLR